MIDIETVRRESPGSLELMHFNNAGASLMPNSVVDAIESHIRLEAKIGGYEARQEQSKSIDQFYQRAAQFLNCQPGNIAFCSNATDAYARALSSIPFQKGDIILTTDDDYVSNHMAFISFKQRFQVEIIRAQNLSNGDLDLPDFEEKIKKHKPKLVAVTHMPTNSGLVQDIEAIGDLCAANDALYLVDACQSLGQISVDPIAIKCDFLSATGRKFLRGPRGTGILYVSDHVLEKGLTPLFVDLRGAHWLAEEEFQISENAHRFELWEIPYALLLGLSEAFQYASSMGISDIAERNRLLANHLRAGLTGINQVRLLDQGSTLSNIITFHSSLGLDLISKALKTHHINHSTAHLENALIDFRKKGVEWAVRLSPHYFNTEKEIDTVVQVLSRAHKQ